jgi:4-amino-4-deoxy-L-arabinose transferase-like glycosyltransferase
MVIPTKIRLIMDEWRHNRQHSHLTSHVSRLTSHVSRLISHTGLLVILVIFLILTTLHSLIVPLTQGEDELAHYRYLSFIAQKGRLPIDETEREQAWYRADWPPLYHLLVGWMVSPLDTTRPQLKDVGESPHRRLVGEIFYPRLIIYTEDVNWPWQDGILAWHIGRFISILFSVAALIFTYLTVLEMGQGASLRLQEQVSRGTSLFSPRLFALTTTAILAFTPRYFFTSAMLGDDSLFILFSAIFIWLLLRALRGNDRWWVYAVLGLLLGLSIATKYSTGLLPLVIIPVALWRARQAGWRWWQWLGRVAIAWGGTLIGAGWWFGWIGYHFNTIKEDGPILGLLSPLLNAGPDVSMRRIFAFFTDTAFTGQERPGAIEAGTFWDWLTYFFQTFWGVPVLEHDPLFPWAYLLMLVFCLLSLVGLWQLWRIVDKEARVTLGVLALIVALLFPFPILRFFLTHNVLETGQGRHLLYPAAQAIPILFMVGWITFGERVGKLRITHHASRITHHASRFTFYVLFPPLLLLLWSIFQLLYMTITYPAPLPVQTTTFNSTSISHSFKHNFGDDIQFLGYDFNPGSEQSSLELTLFWQSLNPVHENYRSQIQLVDPNGRPHLTWLSHPLNGRYPTRAWDKADVVRDALSLPLAALPPNLYTIQINLLHEAEDTPLINEPLAITKFDWPTRQPLVNTSTLGEVEYRLWVDNAPARYRQTLSLSWEDHDDVAQNLTWTLLGPDNIPRPPAASGDTTAIFIVGADWPSGDYRLQLQQNGSGSLQTEPLLTVANEARLFSLPPLPEGFIPVEATFADSAGETQVKLLGYVLPIRRVEPGDGLPLTLYWQSLAPVLDDTLTFAVLLDANLQPHGSVDRYPAGFYSPILWGQGEIVIDRFAVPIEPDAPPGVYALHVGQYELVDDQPESLKLVHQGELSDETAIVISPLKVGGPPPGVTTDTPAPQFILNQTLGDQVTLLGYDLNTSDDSYLKLVLYWRAEIDLQTDYTTFLHLRNATNETVAQKDSPPAAGRYPTSLWNAGEIIVDEIVLPLSEVSPGRYTPIVGLYESPAGPRLTVPGTPANEVALEPIQMEE